MLTAGRTLVVLALALSAVHVAAQDIVLQCAPAQTLANFTLDATLHSVHGSFRLKGGEIRFDPASGKVSGEIVFDATSGQTGNDSRDRKMHKDVLQSQQYPSISFRPDQVVGKVVPQGASAVQVQGVFALRGSEHEITVPVALRLGADRWSATAHFAVPYVRWGLKNPSNVFLHVGDTVEVELHAAGTVAATVR